MESKSRTGLIAAAVIVVIALVGGGLYVASQQNSEEEQPAASQQADTQEPAMTNQTIVDAASADASFSTLVTALGAADLVDTLSGEGPFTVFAPTNSAFDKLPAGTLDSLLLPENKETLKGILTYHVVNGEVLSNQLSDGQVVPTVNGENLTVKLDGGMVYLIDTKGNQSMVTMADMKVDNGVIHAIDTVVMPQ